MVQIVKQSLRKNVVARHVPYLAMLIYRATPLTSSLQAPAEMLNGRKYNSTTYQKHDVLCQWTNYIGENG